MIGSKHYRVPSNVLKSLIFSIFDQYTWGIKTLNIRDLHYVSVLLICHLGQKCRYSWICSLIQLLPCAFIQVPAHSLKGACTKKRQYGIFNQMQSPCQTRHPKGSHLANAKFHLPTMGYAWVQYLLHRRVPVYHKNNLWALNKMGCTVLKCCHLCTLNFERVCSVRNHAPHN